MSEETTEIRGPAAGPAGAQPHVENRDHGPSPEGEAGAVAEPPIAGRPHIRGYGIERGRDGLLPWEWATSRLEQARNYWVTSTRPDGRPHAVPVWGVWIDGTIYFGSGARSRKSRNLAANPAVVVHLESGDETVIAEGIAEWRTHVDDALFDRIAVQYAAKYNGFRPARADGFFAVRPHLVLAWREQDYPQSATRWRLGPTPKCGQPPPDQADPGAAQA